MEQQALIADKENQLIASYEEDEDTIDLYALVLRILENWKLLVLFSVVGALLAGVLTHFFITPVYTTTAKLYMISDSSTLINMSDLQLSNSLAGDYMEVFNVWKVHDEVIERLGLSYTRNEISKMISVTNPSDTRILCIEVTATDPKEAQEIANMYSEVAKEYIAAKMAAPTPSVWEEALLPEEPSSPNLIKNVIIGFLLGFILIAIIISLQFILDDYVRTPEDIEKYVHLPTLSSIMLQDYKDDPKKKSGRKNK